MYQNFELHSCSHLISISDYFSLNIYIYIHFIGMLVLIIAHIHECRQTFNQLSRLVKLLLSIYDIDTLLVVNSR